MRPVYERLEHALALQCERVTRGRYLVTGGRDRHAVDLDGSPPCDCGDHLYRERLCKHLVAVHLREGEQAAAVALGQYAEQLLGADAPPAELPQSFVRADEGLDFTFYRFPAKWVVLGGLADRGILYVRWANRTDVYRGPGTIDSLPSGVRQLLPLLFPEQGL